MTTTAGRSTGVWAEWEWWALPGIPVRLGLVAGETSAAAARLDRADQLAGADCDRGRHARSGPKRPGVGYTRTD